MKPTRAKARGGGCRDLLQRAAFVGVLAGAATPLAGLAQETEAGDGRNATAAASADAAPERARPDPLGAATRDLDALRQNRAQGALGPERVLPRLAVPELNQGAGNGIGPKPATNANRAIPSARLGHEPNWLIEGMTRARDDGGRQAGGVAGRERDPVSGIEAGLEATGTRSRGAAGATVPAVRRASVGRGAIPADEAPAASNPLNPFLSSWMSPSDYALLRPHGQADARAGAALRGDGQIGGVAPGEWSAVLNAGALGGAGRAIATPDRGGGAALGGGIEPTNPFLAGLEPPPRATPVDGGPAADGSFARSRQSADAFRSLPDARDNFLPGAARTSVPAEVSPPNRGASPTGTPVPEFAKPKSDEKLFKPLKRF